MRVGRDEDGPRQGVEGRVERHGRRAGVGRDAERVDVDRVDDEVVAVGYVALGRRGSGVAGGAGVTAHREGGGGQPGAVGGTTRQFGGIRWDVDNDPVPETARCRRIRVEAGDDVAERALGAPHQRRCGETLPPSRPQSSKTWSSAIFSPGEVVALHGERADGRKKIVRIGCSGSVQRHILLGARRDRPYYSMGHEPIPKPTCHLAGDRRYGQDHGRDDRRRARGVLDALGVLRDRVGS